MTSCKTKPRNKQVDCIPEYKVLYGKKWRFLMTASEQQAKVFMDRNKSNPYYKYTVRRINQYYPNDARNKPFDKPKARMKTDRGAYLPVYAIYERKIKE